MSHFTLAYSSWIPPAFIIYHTHHQEPLPPESTPKLSTPRVVKAKSQARIERNDCLCYCFCARQLLGEKGVTLRKIEEH